MVARRTDLRCYRFTRVSADLWHRNQWKIQKGNDAYSKIILNICWVQWHEAIFCVHGKGVYLIFSTGGQTQKQLALLTLRAAANESQKTRNKKQNGLALSRFIVCVTPKQKKHCLIWESCFSETCVKQLINNLFQVTWLWSWLAKWDVADKLFDDVLLTVFVIQKKVTSRCKTG